MAYLRGEVQVRLRYFELTLVVFFALMSLSFVLGLPNLDVSGFDGSTASAVEDLFFYSFFFVFGFIIVRFFRE